MYFINWHELVFVFNWSLSFDQRYSRFLLIPTFHTISKNVFKGKRENLKNGMFRYLINEKCSLNRTVGYFLGDKVRKLLLKSLLALSYNVQLWNGLCCVNIWYVFKMFYAIFNTTNIFSSLVECAEILARSLPKGFQKEDLLCI